MVIHSTTMFAMAIHGEQSHKLPHGWRTYALLGEEFLQGSGPWLKQSIFATQENGNGKFIPPIIKWWWLRDGLLLV